MEEEAPAGQLFPPPAAAWGASNVARPLWSNAFAPVSGLLAPTPLAAEAWRPSAPDAATLPLHLPPRPSAGHVTLADVAAHTQPLLAAATDASLVLGRGFRVGWGPGGMLAIPAVGPSASRVALARMKLEAARRGGGGGGGEAAFARDAGEARLRGRIVRALEVHAAHAPPVPPFMGLRRGSTSDDGGAPSVDAAPQRALRCSPTALAALCGAYLEALPPPQGGAGGPPEDAVGARDALDAALLGSHVEAWALLDILFARAGDEPPFPLALPDHVGDGIPPAAQQALGALPPAPGPESPLETSQRRARLSAWLQQQAARRVSRELRDAGGGGGAGAAPLLRAALLHASARQLTDAAAAAASGGDTRLAMLLVQATGQEAGRVAAAVQLGEWQRSRLLPRIAPARLRLYELCAGNLEAATMGWAPALDWRRCLALHMWYASGPTAPLSRVLAGYAASVRRGSSAPPLPPYAEAGLARAPESLPDLSYALLSLAADGRPGAAVPASAAARLLRPSAASPDPLDASLSWHVAAVLSALRVLPSSGATMASEVQAGGPSPHVTWPHIRAALSSSFAAQLELLGGCSHWAAYVALQAPPSRARGAHLRALLARSIEEWSGVPAKESFLLSRCGLPLAWLSEARMFCASAKRRWAEELPAALDAGFFGRAHALLCAAVGPVLFLAGQHATLVSYLQRLAPHHADVTDWSLGGAIYDDFFRVAAAFDSAQENQAGSQAPALASDLASRLKRAAVTWGTERPAAMLEAVPRARGGAAACVAYGIMSDRLACWTLQATTAAPAPLAAAARRACLASSVLISTRGCNVPEVAASFLVEMLGAQQPA